MKCRANLNMDCKQRIQIAVCANLNPDNLPNVSTVWIRSCQLSTLYIDSRLTLANDDLPRARQLDADIWLLREFPVVLSSVRSLSISAAGIAQLREMNLH